MYKDSKVVFDKLPETDDLKDKRGCRTVRFLLDSIEIEQNYTAIDKDTFAELIYDDTDCFFTSSIAGVTINYDEEFEYYIIEVIVFGDSHRVAEIKGRKKAYDFYKSIKNHCRNAHPYRN